VKGPVPVTPTEKRAVWPTLRVRLTGLELTAVPAKTVSLAAADVAGLHPRSEDTTQS
jgi:hypothetical protein